MVSENLKILAPILWYLFWCSIYLFWKQWMWGCTSLIPIQFNKLHKYSINLSCYNQDKDYLRDYIIEEQIFKKQIYFIIYMDYCDLFSKIQMKILNGMIFSDKKESFLKKRKMQKSQRIKLLTYWKTQLTKRLAKVFSFFFLECDNRLKYLVY